MARLVFKILFVIVTDMSKYNKSEDEEQIVKVAAGDAAVLSLPPLESFPPPSVSWQADDHSLLYGIKYATTDPHNQFIILSTQPSDMKTYR